jgi:hypothetical protein
MKFFAWIVLVRVSLMAAFCHLSREKMRFTPIRSTVDMTTKSSSSWLNNYLNSNLELSDHGKTATLMKDSSSWSCILGDNFVDKFTVRINYGRRIMIGFVPGNLINYNPLDTNDKSCGWYFYFFSGALFSQNGDYDKYFFSGDLNDGDYLTFEFDSLKKEINILHNGIFIDVAFRGINADKLYPAAELFGTGASLTLL